MATWPANGNTDWNTKMLAYLAVSFNTDGTPKASVFGYSAYTNLDSEGNAFLKAHAYKAATDGFVSAFVSLTTVAHAIVGYVGATDDPAGAGTKIQQQTMETSVDSIKGVGIWVAKDEYFEITATSGVPTILWKSKGTLDEPVDQD